jgi:hypothetical protein
MYADDIILSSPSVAGLQAVELVGLPSLLFDVSESESHPISLGKMLNVEITSTHLCDEPFEWARSLIILTYN